MKIGKYVKLAVAAATIGLLPTGVSHADLLVDFGNGSAVEAGFTAFNVGDKVNYNGSFVDVSGTGIDNGADVRVTVLSSGTDVNDYRSVVRNPTDWPGGSSNLLFDWIGMDNRTPAPVADLGLKLENLAAGNYRIKSYHTDIGSSGGNQDGRFNFMVDGVKIIDNFQVRGQISAAPTLAPNILDIVFAADGVNPVDLSYLQQTMNGSGSFQVLNGFELSATTDAVTAAFVPPAPATLYQIDVDTTHGGTAIITEAGWTSLDATLGNGSSVSVDGATFTVFSADGGRNRTGPNDLTRDFVFDDGVGMAVGLTIDNLPAGDWMAEVWAWDGSAADLQIVGLIEGILGSPEFIQGTGLAPDANSPISTFTFTADGTSQYHVFTREDNANNRSRFNALRLTAVVPEPASFMVFGVVGLLAMRRKR